MAWYSIYLLQFKSSGFGSYFTNYIYTQQNRSFIDYIEKDSLFLNPATISIKSEDDEIETAIRGSEMIYIMNSETDFEFWDLMTANRRKFRIITTRNPGTETIWFGYISADLHEEPYMPSPYPVSFHANDGLADLKNFKVSFSGKTLLWDAIVQCISNLDFTDYYIYESCYWYHSGLSHGNSDSPFKQIYFDALVFQNSDGTWMDCYTVLETILKRFNCIIRQNKGNLEIIQIGAQLSSYNRRKYSSDGTYQSYESYNPIKTIPDEDNATVINRAMWQDEWPNAVMMPGWKNYIIDQDYGLVNNLLIGDFLYEGSFHYYTSGRGTAPEPNAGSVWPLINNILIIPVPVISDGFILIYKELGYLTKQNNQFLNIDIAISLSICKARFYLHINNQGDNGDTRYLNSDGSWDAARSYFNETIYSSGYAGQINVKITTNPLPYTGDLTLEIESLYLHHDINIGSNTPDDPNFDPNYRSSFQIDISQSKIEIIDVQNGSPIKDEVTTEIDSGNNKEVTLSTIIGDLPEITNNNLIYKGGLYYKNGSNYIPTSSWKKEGTGNAGNLNEVIGDEVSSMHQKPNIRLEGKLYADITPSTILFEHGVYYMITLNDWDLHDNTNQLTLIQIGGQLTIPTGASEFILVDSDGNPIETGTGQQILIDQ